VSDERPTIGEEEVERLAQVADFAHAAYMREKGASDETILTKALSLGERRAIARAVAEAAMGPVAQDLIIAKACANGMAMDALKTLMEQTGSFNHQNPWLGITSAVALLQLDGEQAERELADARAALGRERERLLKHHSGLATGKPCPACGLRRAVALAATERPEGGERPGGDV